MGPKIFSTLDKFPHYTKYTTLILLAGTIEFVHIEQISALYKFHCIKIKGQGKIKIKMTRKD
jgi:hypothetical protein